MIAVALAFVSGFVLFPMMRLLREEYEIYKCRSWRKRWAKIAEKQTSRRLEDLKGRSEF